MSEIKPVSIKTAEQQITEKYRGHAGMADESMWLDATEAEAAELRAALEALQAENAAQAKRIAHQQFLIDSLMIEYCPDEMTEEQRENWKLHHKRVEL